MDDKRFQPNLPHWMEIYPGGSPYGRCCCVGRTLQNIRCICYHFRMIYNFCCKGNKFHQHHSIHSYILCKHSQQCIVHNCHGREHTPFRLPVSRIPYCNFYKLIVMYKLCSSEDKTGKRQNINMSLVNIDCKLQTSKQRMTILNKVGMWMCRHFG